MITDVSTEIKSIYQKQVLPTTTCSSAVHDLNATGQRPSMKGGITSNQSLKTAKDDTLIMEVFQNVATTELIRTNLIRH